ncbi:MAG: HXXEE domain-containing protein [Candidatus Korarchaeota archaeon]|nr:HXXEE domain-containing protein [Candidatus Korarchaeota archaeon]
MVDFLGALGASLLLIAIVGVHILEEVAKGLRRFFNLEWFRTGDEDFPITKRKAILIDQVGLFVGLALLALLGIKWSFLTWIAIGFITADLIQHGIFSIARRKYTPGVATSLLYLIYVSYVMARSEFGGLNERALIAMALGAAALIINYILAARKVQKRRASQKPEPAAA